MRQEDAPKNPNFITEEDFEKMMDSGKLTRVEDTAPIVPGAPPQGGDPYLSASIPPQLQLSPDLLRTDFGNRIPSQRLMPVAPAGVPGQNSAGQNSSASATQKATAAQQTAATASSTASQAQSTANSASATATTASVGVTTINAKTAVSIVAGTLQQIPISTLGTSSATPNLDNLNDGTTYNRVLGTALTAGAVDSTKAGFLATGGAIPPQIVGNTASLFSYTSTTTSVDIIWSAFTVYFSDGTTASISSGSQNVTGLSPSTTYYFYSYLTGTTVAFANVTGAVGTPAILYTPQSPTAAQAANLQNVTALSNGACTTITPSSGSGGGSSGGGSGRCLRTGMIVEHKERGNVPIESCEVGDWIMSRDGYTQIVELKTAPHKNFVRVTIDTGESVQITNTHHITTADDRSVEVAKLTLSDFLIGKDGFATISKIELLQIEDGQKVMFSCEPAHTVFAGETKPEILAHNQVPVS